MESRHPGLIAKILEALEGICPADGGNAAGTWA